MPIRVKAGNRLTGINAFLAGQVNLKRAAEDLVRKQQWEMEKLYFTESMKSEESRKERMWKSGEEAKSRLSERRGKMETAEVEQQQTLIKEGYLKPTWQREGTMPDISQFQMTPEQQAMLGNILATGVPTAKLKGMGVFKGRAQKFLEESRANISPSLERAARMKKEGMTGRGKKAYTEAMAAYERQPLRMGLTPTSPEEQMASRLGAGTLRRESREQEGLDRQVYAWIIGQQPLGDVPQPQTGEEAYWGLLKKQLDPYRYMEWIKSLPKPWPKDMEGMGGDEELDAKAWADSLDFGFGRNMSYGGP